MYNAQSMLNDFLACKQNICLLMCAYMTQLKESPTHLSWVMSLNITGAQTLLIRSFVHHWHYFSMTKIFFFMTRFLHDLDSCNLCEFLFLPLMSKTKKATIFLSQNPHSCQSCVCMLYVHFPLYVSWVCLWLYICAECLVQMVAMNPWLQNSTANVFHP